MGPARRRIGIGGLQRRQPGGNGSTAVAHLHLHLDWLLRRRDRHPVHGSHHRFTAGGIAAGGHHHAVHGAIQAHHMQRLAPGHTEPLALTDREVLNAVVLAHHAAVVQHDLALARGQVGVQKRAHRAVVVGQTEVLAFRFISRAQPMAGGFNTGVGLGEFTQRKHQAA